MLRKLLQRADHGGESLVIAPPVLSIVVIVYDMAEQAEKTVRSLLLDYQRGVRARDYEVIIVENESARPMAEAFTRNLPANFRYFYRKNAECSPATAINFGARRARGEHICVMIDGARMLTPGVVRNLLLGHQLSPRSVVSVPGYHLGAELQQLAVNSGYGNAEEARLLSSIDWPLDGYRLFDISCFSGSSAPGFFLPNSESNCISLPRNLWQELQGFDEQFDLSGGGLINLDFYKRACELPGVTHVVCIGEGTFHQFHGGVTTGGQAAEKRAAYIDEAKAQYRKLRGAEFESPHTEPVFLGEISVNAMRFVQQSMARVDCSQARVAQEAGVTPLVRVADA
ncbi:glycosyltransferase family A protein [Parahaliea mediterranea]|uniref:glycosyltransferase family A protein n=1 Tax=Parahaliea mediterranea TaxID=651086 RepID=UPI000E2FD8C8|nr:glycosyltransferase family A protein [Parahaliea mediterranea]